MSGSVSSEKAEPNLTPILDMVFQLITFFMLVINFKTASLNLSLELPVIGSAKPVETKGIDLVILNIDANGEMMSNGQKKRTDEEKIASIKDNAAKCALAARKVNRDFDPQTDELPAIVVLRADSATPFDKLYFVIEKCQDNGFRNFALRAYDKPPSSRKNKKT